MNQPSTGYLMVYHLEIALLFATLVAIGPLVRDPAARRRAGHAGQALPNPSV
jgi:BCD family chlorophyll transporter-like MFS transporter